MSAIIEIMVHEAASSGFRRRAETYQRARPSYHPSLVDRFVSRYGHGVVVEIGAGTGIFTGQLARAGVNAIAIEPIVEMRNVLRSQLPDIDVRDGTAERIPLETASVDTVVAAQAFHWFRYPDALAEMARVLRPGGFLATVWNVRDETVQWEAALTRVLDLHAGETPRHRTMLWREAIENDTQFELVDDWRIDNPTPTTVQGVIDRVLSTSFVAALPHDEQVRVIADVQQTVERLGPNFEFPYRSEIQAWQRR